ncbi:MAG: ligase-associated DNA damage response endonuclease PdeM [Akkermansiaceae bacterium]|nr:ligase-associated DNA damage response endonuclease PdeM [Akkermansiaceae bacterium]
MLEEGSRQIVFAGEELVLLAERAALWPARRALMLSDVHFGKSATFRAHGIPVPEGECQADLDRITHLVERHGIEHLVIVGDFFHSGLPLTDSLHAMLSTFRDTLRAEIILIRGNHDPLHHHLLPMQDRLTWSPIEFVHDPALAAADQPTIAGHLHPLCRIGTGGRNSRLPCFLLTDTRLVLPAFGTFTAGQVNKPTPGQTLYPIAKQTVFHCPGD